MIMASSAAGYIDPMQQQQHASSSSSSSRSPQAAIVEDDSDNDDPVANFSRDQALLSEDPLDATEPEVISFKRKQKKTVGARFLSAISGSGSTSQQTTSPLGASSANLDGSVGLNEIGANREGLNSNSGKDGVSSDWYIEGPGRRVAYEDLTAIDWIFEYTKERQRLRVLYSSASGIVGYAQQLLDSSQVWFILILTGLAAGLFAAGIDVVSDWLGDLKTGYCSAGADGGHFYLNKYFCCFGYDGWAQCRDWVPWSTAVHITSKSGKWFIEYFFFVIFSVWTSNIDLNVNTNPDFHRCSSR